MAAVTVRRHSPASPWTSISVGAPSVAVAERHALGTVARVAVWPGNRRNLALAAVDAQLARLDLAASRFRPDSEICQIQGRLEDGSWHVSQSLAEIVGVALAAAQWTDGLVDPTVGAALIALGYDRDFVLVGADQPDVPPARVEVPGWRSISLQGRLLQLPAGIKLDFGATAKGLGADWAAREAFAACGRGGVLVSLGGDVASSGEAPLGGWPVLIEDGETQVVRLPGGAIATSSTTCRQWRRAGKQMHHIVDPRTGQPAVGPWRAASVAAATCAEANAAATAAIVSGAGAADWLEERQLPARLVSHQGNVLNLAGWPDIDGGLLAIPPDRMPPLNQGRGGH